MELDRRVRDQVPEEEWVGGGAEEEAEVVWAVVVKDQVESVFVPPAEPKPPTRGAPPATS